MTTAFLAAVICPWQVSGKSLLLVHFSQRFPGIATVSLKLFHENPRRVARLNPTSIHLVWCLLSKYSFGKRCKKTLQWSDMGWFVFHLQLFL